MKHRSNIRVHYIWMSWNTYSCHRISVRNVITDLKTTTYTFKQRRRLILFKTEDDILIEVYKTSKRYVPAFMCRRFSNGYPNFNFDYYHYILEVQHILFNTEDNIYFLTQTTTFKLSLRWITYLKYYHWSCHKLIKPRKTNQMNFIGTSKLYVQNIVIGIW